MTAILRCELGDLPISEGLLRLPVRGNWTASVTLGWESAPSIGSVAELVFVREDESEDVFAGVIRRSGFLPGSQTVTATVVGGAGNLLELVPPRDYVAGSAPLPAGLVARGIVDDVGEQLAAGVELALDGLTLPRWTRIASSARAALDLLADRLGLGWRVLADGTIWVGVETWPELDNAAFYVGGDPSDGAVLYASDGAPLVVGSTVDGVQAIAVEYSIGASLRATVRGVVPGDPVRVPDLTAYRASYAAVVRAQRDDGSLDLDAEDNTIGALLGVRFRIGIPGATATIPPGSWVRVLFESADPRGAYAIALDQDPAATAKFALVGDGVDCAYLTGVAPPGGGPVVFAVSPVPVPNAVHITGSVSGPGHRYLSGVKGP